MDLLEYQAKELFREMGIPVLPSQRIDRPKDLKGLTIPYPVVLKSQVYIGGRGRVGGVKFVENTIDAIAAAQTIFNLPIMGEYPKMLLAEAKYDADQEFYLAVALNRSVRRPVLLGSPQGGVDVQAAIDQMQHIIVEQDFSPYYARRLAIKMGLQGTLIETVSSIVEKMYQLFITHDLDLVEINPLGISATGEVMALDGKVSANDDALARHPQLVSLITKLGGNPPEASELSSVGMDTNGDIGIICNGAGLTMATMDLVGEAGGKTASFLNIGGETRWDTSPDLLKQRLAQGLELMTQQKSIRVILINLISNLVPCDEMAEVIIAYLKRRAPQPRPIALRSEAIRPDPVRADPVFSPTKRGPALVIRLIGCQSDRARTLLEAAQLSLLENLDEAVTEALSFVKTELPNV
ncbi:MAG: succinate--CoA ligase subunit beta [Leptolyngbyaceae cyanobacterium bins.349]|nr:succinate--CoA ligase subunit beta [Leptolyngbyaceae cyanobacterium bins.349]